MTQKFCKIVRIRNCEMAWGGGLREREKVSKWRDFETKNSRYPGSVLNMQTERVVVITVYGEENAFKMMLSISVFQLIYCDFNQIFISE